MRKLKQYIIGIPDPKPRPAPSPLIPQVPVSRGLGGIPRGTFPCRVCGKRHTAKLDLIGELPAVVRYRCDDRRVAVVLVDTKAPPMTMSMKTPEPSGMSSLLKKLTK